MTLSEDLRELATEVSSWDAGASERLESLASAVEDDGDLDAWREVDVLDGIAPFLVADAVRGRTSRSQVLAWLERVRNAAVLLPVALTWLGLMYAAVGYRDAIAAHPDWISQPFLLLWENGFDGTLKLPFGFERLLTLSTLAAVDIAIIGFLVVVTWLIHGIVNVGQARRERVAYSIERRLHHAAWQASSVVAAKTRPESTVDQIKSIAEELLNELRAERERLAKLSDSRERQLSDLSRFASNLKSSTDKLQRSSTGLTAPLRSIESTAKSLEALIDSLRQKEGDLAAAMTDVAGSLALQSAEVQKFAGDANAALFLLRDTAVQQTSVAGSVAALVQQVRAEVLGLGEVVASGSAAYESAAAVAQRAAEKVEATMGPTATVASVANSLAETSKALERAVQALEALRPVQRSGGPRRPTGGDGEIGVHGERATEWPALPHAGQPAVSHPSSAGTSEGAPNASAAGNPPDDPASQQAPVRANRRWPFNRT